MEGVNTVHRCLHGNAGLIFPASLVLAWMLGDRPNGAGQVAPVGGRAGGSDVAELKETSLLASHDAGDDTDTALAFGEGEVWELTMAARGITGAQLQERVTWSSRHCWWRCADDGGGVVVVRR